jgi:ATP-binding cassette, subfamily B, bacterial
MKRPPTRQEKLPGLGRIFLHLWPYVRKHRALAAGSLLMLLVQASLHAVEPWPLKYILDYLFGTKRTGRLPSIPGLHDLGPTTVISLAALAIVVVTGLRAVADYLSALGFAVVGNRVLTEVRSNLYRHLQGLSLSFHTQARSGDLIVRVIADVNVLKNIAINAALPLLAELLIVVFMVGVMFWLNWELALLALTTLPLFALATVRLTHGVKRATRAQRQREGAMASTAAEAIGAIKLVQALSLEGLFADAFVRENLASQKEDIKSLRLAAVLRRAVGFLIAACSALVLWYGARLALRGDLTPGELVVFLSYLRSAFKPVQEFARLTGRLAKATAAGERVLDLLARTPEIRDRPDARPAPPFRGAVRLEGVSFAYEPGRRVLEHLDFAVEPGQQVALVGPSGIGKSTLVSLLLRLYDPEEGRVLIDGRDIREYTLASLRAQISVVLQDTVLFATTVAENIAYGAPGADREAIEAAARLANAHEFILALPQGYATILGERGVTLSGGQRQRIALARAAIRRSPILVLDEPTTGLDEENQRAVLEALSRLARNRTAFFITHDLQRVASADLILYLERGRVFERGTHRELMQTNGRYAAVYKERLAAEQADHRKPRALVH